MYTPLITRPYSLLFSVLPIYFLHDCTKLHVIFPDPEEWTQETSSNLLCSSLWLCKPEESDFNWELCQFLPSWFYSHSGLLSLGRCGSALIFLRPTRKTCLKSPVIWCDIWLKRKYLLEKYFSFFPKMKKMARFFKQISHVFILANSYWVVFRWKNLPSPVESLLKQLVRF